LSDDDCAQAAPAMTVSNVKPTTINRLQHAFIRMPSLFGLKNRTGPSVSPELRGVYAGMPRPAIV